MAGYGGNEFWEQQQQNAGQHQQSQQQHQSYNFEMPEQFGQDMYEYFLNFNYSFCTR